MSTRAAARLEPSIAATPAKLAWVAAAVETCEYCAGDCLLCLTMASRVAWRSVLSDGEGISIEMKFLTDGATTNSTLPALMWIEIFDQGLRPQPPRSDSRALEPAPMQLNSVNARKIKEEVDLESIRAKGASYSTVQGGTPQAEKQDAEGVPRAARARHRNLHAADGNIAALGHRPVDGKPVGPMDVDLEDVRTLFFLWHSCQSECLEDDASASSLAPSENAQRSPLSPPVIRRADCASGLLEADESTRMRMGNSIPHHHEDHIA